VADFKPPEDLEEQVRDLLEAEPELSWDEAVAAILGYRT
jgi:hypothetical protein